MSKLTDHLSSTLGRYTAATERQFLTSAASLTLPAAQLALYLSQDHIYSAQAFPRFIAQLILKIPLDNPSATPLAARSLSLLARCLTHIGDELAFSDSTARTYNLSSNHWRERKGTQDLTAEMARIGTFGTLEDGLVFLWSMEKIFSDAWSTVYRALPKPSPSESKKSQSPADLNAKAIRDLAYHWSDANLAFAQFVKELGDLVNDYFAPVIAGQPLAGQSAPEALARAEAVVVRVLELGAEIWPNPGDEVTYHVSK